MCSHQNARRRLGALAVAALLVAAPLAAQAPPASGSPHPLEPPDRSSPRATLETLLESIDETLALYKAGDPEYRERYALAKRCIDPSRLAPRIAERATGEATLLLKEVLDRLELPPRSEIPDARRVEEEALTSWRVPHTEIELVRMEEGDRAGEFLFSAETVARAAEFYQRVRHLPYQPGKQGALYDEIRFGSQSALITRLVDRLPASAKREVAGQAAWQWLGLALVLIAAGALTMAALRAGRKYTRPVVESRGLNRLWAFVGPAALIAIPLLVRRISFEQLTIWGTVGLQLRLLMTMVAVVGAAWLTVVVVTRGAEHLIRGLGLERPLNKQLIRVTSRALALLLVLAWMFFAGQRLGLPLTAMVAGLGVGGLAVALAAQSSIENLIGGISLYADQPVRIGEWLQLGDRRGCLEEVGLRSSKIRTPEGTLFTLPNAEFAKLAVVNLSRREKTLLKTSLRLRYDTSRDQLQFVLAKLEAMLLEHPELDPEEADAKLVGFGPYFLEVQFQAFAKTTSIPRFKEIRQDVFMRALAIVEEAGTALALPSEIHYTAEDRGSDPARVREVEAQVARWRERGELPNPEDPEGTD